MTDDLSTLRAICSEIEKPASSAVVPGELRSWCRTLEESLRKLQPLASAVYDRELDNLGQVTDEDPELHARVAALRDRLDSSRRVLEEIRERLSKVCSASKPAAESSEEPTHDGERLRLRLLEWTVATRALDGEIVTWTQESLNRDHGVAD